MDDKQLITIIAAELNLRWNQVHNTIQLLDDDNTVPFIARYRKEATGSLDEEVIRAIWDRMRYLRHLEERKQTVLNSIHEQGKLTPELEEKIKAATKLQEVEGDMNRLDDIFPYVSGYREPRPCIERIEYFLRACAGGSGVPERQRSNPIRVHMLR